MHLLFYATVNARSARLGLFTSETRLMLVGLQARKNQFVANFITYWMR